MPPKREVSELQASVSELIEKVDNLTKIINSEKIIELNESIIFRGEKLDSLSKSTNDNHNTVIVDIANIRDGIIQKLVASDASMSNRFTKIDDTITILERQINLNTQRSRENNLEFHKVPDTVNDESLQNSILQISKVCNTNIDENDIRVIQRLPKRRGKVCKQTSYSESIMCNRMKLNNVT